MITNTTSVQAIYDHFQRERTLPEGNPVNYPNPGKFEETMEHLIDEFLPALDNHSESHGTDMIPEPGLLTVPDFRGVGLLSGRFEGDSQGGELVTAYKNGSTTLTRRVFYSEDSVDALHVWKLEDSNKIRATVHHISRNPGKDSFSMHGEWNLA